MGATELLAQESGNTMQMGGRSSNFSDSDFLGFHAAEVIEGAGNQTGHAGAQRPEFHDELPMGRARCEYVSDCICIVNNTIEATVMAMEIDAAIAGLESKALHVQAIPKNIRVVDATIRKFSGGGQGLRGDKRTSTASTAMFSSHMPRTQPKATSNLLATMRVLEAGSIARKSALRSRRS